VIIGKHSIITAMMIRKVLSKEKFSIQYEITKAAKANAIPTG
jgi:hypothetical protein